jgi:hypothetical protein
MRKEWAEFDLLSEWHFDAPVEWVWPVLRAVEQWPDWWPNVAAVETLAPAGSDGVGARHRLFWTSFLPYHLVIDTKVVALEPMRRIEVAADGELEGQGIWTFEPSGDACTIRYRWRVSPRKPWMRRLAPILAPVFAWNHGKVMESGRRGLAGRLAAQASGALSSLSPSSEAFASTK